MYFLKILISLSGAVMLATLPGFFDISYGVSGLTIRAAGGAAAFVFIYTQSPNIPNFNKPTAAPLSTAPATPRPGTSSSNDRHDSDATPLLVALSIDPGGVWSSLSSRESNGGRASDDSRMQGISATQGSTVLLGKDDAALGIIAKSGRASTVLSGVTAVIHSGAEHLASGALELLNRVAAALRATVSWMGGKLLELADHLKALRDMPASDLSAFIASIPEAAEDLVNSAVSPAIGAVDQLTANLNLDGSLLGGVGVGETVNDVTHILGSTVGGTVDVVGDLVTGVLHSPKDTLALTGKAVGDLTDNLAGATKGLTDSVQAQVSAITTKLNDVTPGIVSRIDPALGRLDETTAKLQDIAGDVTAALPPLTSTLATHDVLPLGQSAGLQDSKVEEIRGGCETCLLQPLAVSSRLSSREGLGGALSGLGLGRGGDGARGAAGGGGGAGAGAGQTGGGAVSSAVSGVRSAVGNTTRGLLGRR